MSTLATGELEALEEALADPSHAGLAEAVRRVAEAAARSVDVEQTSSAFMRRLVKLLREIRGVEFAGERLEAITCASFHFYLVGLPFEGAAYAAEAVDLGRRTGNRFLGRALMLRGMMDADTGNIPRAVEWYVEALEFVRAAGDDAFFVDVEASIWLNLGCALLYAAQHRDALACFERVGQMAASRPIRPKLASAAVADIALCCLHLGDIERGLRAAESVLRGLGEPKSEADLISRVLREHYYARLLLEAGEVSAACEHAAIARRYAQASGSPRAEIPAAMASGLSEVYAGREESGVELLKRTVERARRELPVMLRDSLTVLVKAYEFLGMPRQALTHLDEALAWLRQWEHDNLLEHVRRHLHPPKGAALSTLASRLRSQEAQLRGKVVQQEAFRSPSEMLERLAVTAELREDSTGEHCYRLGRLAALLAREAGCDEALCARIESAARLHDIGKHAIPDAIILKRGKLTDAERQIMRTHSAAGAELLAGSNIPGMRTAEEIARHHHDWWDGSNVESRSGEGIPYAARIVAIVDVFDALTHERPHRGAWSIREAVEEIARLRGTQFDPRLTDLFVELVQKLRREHQDLDAFLGEAAKTSSFLLARLRIKEALQRGQ